MTFQVFAKVSRKLQQDNKLQGKLLRIARERLQTARKVA